MHVIQMLFFYCIIFLSLNQFRLQTHNFGHISVALMHNHHCRNLFLNKKSLAKEQCKMGLLPTWIMKSGWYTSKLSQTGWKMKIVYIKTTSESLLVHFMSRCPEWPFDCTRRGSLFNTDVWQKPEPRAQNIIRGLQRSLLPWAVLL